MVKPMFQNKGFTLIEMLLVISIILTLSVLSFPFMNTKTIYITDECVKKQIGMIINQAKSKAIISHEKVSLIVSKQEISFIDHQKKYRVVLTNNYFFNNIKEIYISIKMAIQIKQIILISLHPKRNIPLFFILERVIMSLNKKGFTLIESLFAFSIFTTVIILLVSLYVTNSKTNIKVNQEYETYQSEKQQIEYTLNLDEGIETCLKKALH